MPNDPGETAQPQARPQPLAEFSDQEHLTAFLASRDAACPACKYNLRQLVGSKCPECGIPLILTVGASEGLGKAWLTALLSSVIPGAMGLPFQIGLLIVLGYGESIIDIADTPEGLTSLLLVLYSICCIPVAIALLAGRSNFMRWGLEVQQRVAGFLLVAFLIAGFCALMLIGSTL